LCRGLLQEAIPQTDKPTARHINSKSLALNDDGMFAQKLESTLRNLQNGYDTNDAVVTTLLLYKVLSHRSTLDISATSRGHLQAQLNDMLDDNKVSDEQTASTTTYNQGHKLIVDTVSKLLSEVVDDSSTSSVQWQTVFNGLDCVLLAMQKCRHETHFVQIYKQAVLAVLPHIHIAFTLGDDAITFRALTLVWSVCIMSPEERHITTPDGKKVPYIVELIKQCECRHSDIRTAAESFMNDPKILAEDGTRIASCVVSYLDYIKVTEGQAPFSSVT
jgi:hypothetical protein